MRYIFFLVVVTFFSSVANGQNQSDEPNQLNNASPHSPPLLDHDKVYVELLLGLTKQETEYPQDLSLSGDGLSFGLRSGYIITPYLAAELGYVFHGTSEAEGATATGSNIKSKISSSSINAGLKAALPLSEQFLINASVGMAYWSADLELTGVTATGGPYTGEDSGYDPYYGGSLIYKPNETFYFGLEYTAYEYSYRVQSVEMSQNISAVALLFGTKI